MTDPVVWEIDANKTVVFFDGKCYHKNGIHTWILSDMFDRSKWQGKGQALQERNKEKEKKEKGRKRRKIIHN